MNLLLTVDIRIFIDLVMQYFEERFIFLQKRSVIDSNKLLYLNFPLEEQIWDFYRATNAQRESSNHDSKRLGEKRCQNKCFRNAKTNSLRFESVSW